MNPDVGLTLVLEDDLLTLGDRFYLRMTLGPLEQTTCLDAYVLLEVDGLFWCWPGWLPLESDLDYRSYSLAAGQTIPEDLLDFLLPQVDGSLSGLYFYGAAFGADTFDLIGDVQVIEFGYR